MDLLAINPQAVLNSVQEGLYITDVNRNIVYWSPSAEAITGWSPREVMGKSCRDGILCHIDKDGHELCGEEHCPLHRAMLTGSRNAAPLIVFARTKKGPRIPLRVHVAPIFGDDGKVIGGVETFFDLSGEFSELEQAQKFQARIMQTPAGDDRIQFNIHYIPCEIVGGDYYKIAKLDDDKYVFILADVTGHGLLAALYTMYLDSLWKDYHQLLARPVEFAKAVNDRLHELMQEDMYFAAGLCGMIDLAKGQCRIVGAASPSPLLFRKDGTSERVNASGLPIGIMPEHDYAEHVFNIAGGDTLLMFTDGAVEITGGKQDEWLSVEGLQKILCDLGYPNSGVNLADVEQQLLINSDRVRFDDDMTFIEIKIS